MRGARRPSLCLIFFYTELRVLYAGLVFMLLLKPLHSISIAVVRAFPTEILLEYRELLKGRVQSAPHLKYRDF